MINSLVIELGGYLLGIAAFLIGWFVAKQKGKREAQEQARSERLESMQIAKEVRENVQAASDDELIAEFDRLHNRNRR